MKLAIIGGSLLNDIDDFANVTEEVIKTPFGQPSDSFLSGNIEGKEFIFLNRHGREHFLAPHQINYRANMFALKLLEVTHVFGIAAVGGITKDMKPMQWIIPDQLIDYTYGRMQSYNDGNDTEVKHIDFTYPFTEALRSKIAQAMGNENMPVVNYATYGVTQGPRLETVAEINRMERDGCDIVGMTAMPEIALARELEMEYATAALVVNWAAGRGTEANGKAEVISMDEIKQRISTANEFLPRLITRLLLR